MNKIKVQIIRPKYIYIWYHLVDGIFWIDTKKIHLGRVTRPKSYILMPRKPMRLLPKCHARGSFEAKPKCFSLSIGLGLSKSSGSFFFLEFISNICKYG